MESLNYIWRNFVRSAPTAGLPQRVLTRIAERDWANEKLVRIIQLAVIVTFCLIYALSPKTFPPGAITPVPWVLAVYLVLSVIGLLWIMRNEPPDWAVYISILFDFSLLYGLMVSFHIQYMQPASFVLKAPALLYVFIFIAVRALRLDAKFVLAAGLAAAAGWAAMIYYVTQVDPGDNMLTRSYVEYLTSNSILIGAEVDKILSILLVTGILALAVRGSQNLLATAVTEQAAAADLSRFFDREVADGIRSSAQRLQAGEGRRAECTVLNIDIRGFSRLAARLEPGQVMHLLAAYQGLVLPVIRTHGGLVDKFMGDGVMVVFGLGETPEGQTPTHAADALGACEDLLRASGQWSQEATLVGEIGGLTIGLGVATGPLVWGTVGREDRLEMTVIGHPVNLSAKLEKHNKVLGSQCLVAAQTLEMAHRQGYAGALFGSVKAQRIEGIAEPVECAVLTLRSVSMVTPGPALQPMPSNSAEDR